MNNKGFMLLEVIIASVFLISVMVGLFVSYNKILIAYQQRAKYYDIDCLYAAQYIQEDLITSGEINQIITNYLKYDIYDDYDDYLDDEIKIPSDYGVTSVYIFAKGEGNLTLVEKEKQSFNDYITFLNNRLTGDDTESEYLLIVERQNGDIYYYNYLPLM